MKTNGNNRRYRNYSETTGKSRPISGRYKKNFDHVESSFLCEWLYDTIQYAVSHRNHIAADCKIRVSIEIQGAQTPNSTRRQFGSEHSRRLSDRF